MLSVFVVTAEGARTKHQDVDYLSFINERSFGPAATPPGVEKGIVPLQDGETVLFVNVNEVSSVEATRTD